MTLLNESRAVDLQIRWAELALESAQLQYDIAVSETSDGVLTESENEALFMEAEAAAQKSKNIIIRAIEKVIDFIKSVASKIAAAFSEKKVKSDLDEIKKIKDPDLKAAKIEVPDWKDAEKNVANYEKAIANAEKKAKAGKLTQADIDGLNDAKERCGTSKKVVIGAVAGALALGGLVIGTKARSDKLVAEVKAVEDDAKKQAKEGTDPQLEKYRNRMEKLGKSSDTLVNSGDEGSEQHIRTLENMRKVNNAKEPLEALDSVRIHKINAAAAKSKLDLMYSSIFRKFITFISSKKLGIEKDEENKLKNLAKDAD